MEKGITKKNTRKVTKKVTKNDCFHDIANKLTILKLIFHDAEALNEDDIIDWKEAVENLIKKIDELKVILKSEK